MSYILDALERAQAERGREQVPGQPTPQHPGATPPGRPSPGVQGVTDGAAGASATPLPPSAQPAGTPGHQWTRRAWPLGLGLLALAGWAASAWWRSPSPSPPTTVATTAVTATAVPAATVVPVPVPANVSATVPAPSPAPAKSASTKPAAVKPPRAKPEKAPPPVTVRAERPNVRISGVVYTADPAQRLLMVNQQVLGQGAQVSPGLVLEEIEPHSAVFSFHGARWRVNH